jgi:hypothetical protein|tara:strand:+ start:2763 stop:3053 length:291 start_codon:yes stop_codon:yes gene_type:complete
MTEEIDEKIEHEVKDKWLVRWWKTLIYEEYKLTIYFVANKTVDERGRETYTRTPKHYKATKFYSLKPKFIKFKDDEDQIIEIKSEEPMNWDLVKVY